MLTANASAEDFELQNQAKMDEGLLVRFLIRTRQDTMASATAGRPVFKDTEYIEIRTPGSRDAICRPAKAGDFQRFPRHYEAFKNRVSQENVVGTPLIEWPVISRSRAEELAFFNVKTVEQLVAMPDNLAQKIMGINELKTKAKAWLKVAKEDQKAVELQEELSKRDAEIAELRDMIKDLQAAPKPPLRKKVGMKKVTSKKVAAKKE